MPIQGRVCNSVPFVPSSITLQTPRLALFNLFIFGLVES
jgi:hypothetical protein